MGRGPLSTLYLLQALKLQLCQVQKDLGFICWFQLKLLQAIFFHLPAMFSALGNLLKADDRNISLFEHAPKQYAFATTGTPVSSSELSKIDELKQRTHELSLQHEENSRKALLDEAIINSREESAQLMQLSLRMLLDVVDRQSEVAHLDLAKTLYGDRLPSSNLSTKNVI